jgi:hypothetical protein
MLNNFYLCILMANTIKDNNPFGNPDGTPIDGKEDEFFAWGREQELKRREKLPESERKAIEKSEQALDRRMNS